MNKKNKIKMSTVNMFFRKFHINSIPSIEHDLDMLKGKYGLANSLTIIKLSLMRERLIMDQKGTNKQNADENLTAKERKEVKYNGMTIAQLKIELRKKGMKVSGNKPELIQRLLIN